MTTQADSAATALRTSLEPAPAEPSRPVQFQAVIDHVDRCPACMTDAHCVVGAALARVWLLYRAAAS